MNVVLYLRYSSDKQDEQSIEGQRRICESFCEQNGMRIIGEYIDRAASAFKDIEKREQFQKMLKDSAKHHFDAVVVYKLDRFARTIHDHAISKHKLKKNGVDLISASETITNKPEGVIMESVLMGMAEYFSMELSQKVTRGMNETALKGNFCGGPIPIGYKVENKKLVVDELTAPLVKEAFERYSKGQTIAQICNAFNERGLITAKGTPYNKSSFRTMFKNERYIGIYRYKEIVNENGIPPIIEKELFETVQERLRKNAKAPARGKAKVEYLLAQKIFCGHCGAVMTGECGTSKNGEKYNYYTCGNRKRKHSCSKKNLRKEWIEKTVVQDAKALLTPERIEEIADMVVKEADLEMRKNSIIPSLQAELKEIEKAINGIIKIIERGADSDAIVERINTLERQKKDLKIRIADEEKLIERLDREHVIWWLERFTEGDVNDIDYQRLIIYTLVNSVTVWDEPDGWFKITTIYNLKDNNAKTYRCSVFDEGGSPNKKDDYASSRLFLFISSLFSKIKPAGKDRIHLQIPSRQPYDSNRMI